MEQYCAPQRYSPSPQRNARVRVLAFLGSRCGNGEGGGGGARCARAEASEGVYLMVAEPTIGRGDDEATRVTP